MPPMPPVHKFYIVRPQYQNTPCGGGGPLCWCVKLHAPLLAKKNEIPSKNVPFQWEKVANGLSGCNDNPHRLDPIKKDRPDYPFSPKFFRRPEVRTDKKLSGREHTAPLLQPSASYQPQPASALSRLAELLPSRFSKISQPWSGSSIQGFPLVAVYPLIYIDF